MKKNEHAVAALDAYLETSHPVPHALLIEGPWGSGKTTFLKDVYFPDRLKRAKSGADQNMPIFISLFGLKSVEDIQRRIWEEISPVGSKVGSLLGAGVSSVAGLFQVGAIADALGKLTLGELEKQLSDRIFVFDDLERVETDLGIVLGFINQLVEQRRQKVVLVANQADLLRRDDARWSERSEKLVGRIIRLTPPASLVIERFTKNLSEQDDGFTWDKDFSAGIENIFSHSDIGNLRSLSWSLTNVRWLFSNLNDIDVPADHLMKIAALTTAVTLEVRAGRLLHSDLENSKKARRRRNRQLFPSGRTTPKSGSATARWTSFVEKYKDIDPDRPAIDYPFLLQLELTGGLDLTAFKNWLRENFGIGDNNQIPAWRRLWGSTSLEPNELEAGIDQLTKDFAEGNLTEFGPILHAAGHVINFASCGDLTITNGEEATKFLRNYITRIRANGTLQPLLERGIRFDVEGGYGGLGYIAASSSEFADVQKHLFVEATARGREAAATMAQDILNQAENGDTRILSEHVFDPNFRMLRYNCGFREVEPERMAKLALSSSAMFMTTVEFIRFRYGDLPTDKRLLDELPWLRSVVELVAVALEPTGEYPELVRKLRKISLRGYLMKLEDSLSPDEKILEPLGLGQGDSCIDPDIPKDRKLIGSD